MKFSAVAQENQLGAIIDRLLPLFKEYKILLLAGDLGAGKTTLCKALLKAMGITEDVSSPTFNLLNIYENNQYKIYHYDFYRLKDPQEISELALDEALENYTIIEWPEFAADFITQDALKLKISTLDQTQRNYELNIS